ncbi:MAG: hypothetical protein LBB93_06060 [Elusimicrobiota bacterium]|jgi:hypothetical protein|nr:hypothetical protein [Elusimicrobiota bacterium]
MNFDFAITVFLPLLSGMMYFFMAVVVRRVGKYRAIMFGEIGFRKLEFAFAMFGVYFITRPLQNFIGPHPLPMIINSLRQLFLMAFIAPSVLVAIFHWVPTPSGAPKSQKFAAYAVGCFMGIIFVLTNSLLASSSKILYSYRSITIYDAVWAANGAPEQLILIHLLCQLISPIGFFVLAASYIKHRRHEYKLSYIYNLMPTKWKYLEASLIIFAFSFIVAGIAVTFGSYYTYIWVIYFVGAIISGLFGLRSISLPPRETPQDLK